MSGLALQLVAALRMLSPLSAAPNEKSHGEPSSRPPFSSPVVAPSGSSSPGSAQHRTAGGGIFFNHTGACRTDTPARVPSEE